MVCFYFQITHLVTSGNKENLEKTMEYTKTNFVKLSQDFNNMILECNSKQDNLWKKYENMEFCVNTVEVNPPQTFRKTCLIRVNISVFTGFEFINTSLWCLFGIYETSPTEERKEKQKYIG